MLSKPIQEWLTEFKGLTEEESHTFACTVRQNEALIESLYALFERRPPAEELDPVCHQLFTFYRSSEDSLRRFALELLPCLLCLYLRCLSHNDKHACTGLEAFLLGVYNLEIVDSDGSPKIKTFRITSINQGSIYHEPVQLSALSLTESTLNRYNRYMEEWRGGPHPHYESLNSQNRQAVLSYLLHTYNEDIAQLSTHSLKALCQTASRVSITGMPRLQVSPSELQSWPSSQLSQPQSASSNNAAQPPSSSSTSSSSPTHLPRMTVSPGLLVELLWGVNFALYNGCEGVARQAVQDVHARACFELLPDVQLVTQAILHSHTAMPGEADLEGPMGISVSSVSSSPHASLSKGTLTNASFKTKKLPDDIPMAPGTDPEPPTPLSSKLSPIEEESRGLAKQVLRLSKGRGKKDDKDKKVKDADTSLGLITSDSLDSVTVTVLRNKEKVTVDSVELRPLGKRYSEDHPLITKSNSSSTASRRKSMEKGGGGGDPPRSRPNSFHGALINPDPMQSAQ